MEKKEAIKMERKEAMEKTWARFSSELVRSLDYTDLVSDIVDSALDCMSDSMFDESDVINEAIDSGLIYYSDKWKILMEHCVPNTANWEYAFEKFVEDVYTFVSMYKEIKEN